MSDFSQGPGWWIASDGQWYPPESHPSVTGLVQTEEPVHVGPRFPDLFEQAMRGSSLADSVSVVTAEGIDERQARNTTARGAASSPDVGPASKRRRRQAH